MKRKNLVFLGAPGAGKGTIAEILSEKENLVHISTGDIFRREIKRNSELGKKAKAYVTSGGLVPDELVVDLVASRLLDDDCVVGYILDGFPRTIPQAEFFKAKLKEMGSQIDLVIYFEASEELLIQRLTARIICKQCGTNFNKLFSKPKVEGVCDKCSGELYQRPDDSLETATDRLKVYNEFTAPLVDFYQAEDLLVTLDGTQAKDITLSAVLEVLS